MLQEYRPARTLRTTDCNLLLVPRVRQKLLRRVPSTMLRLTCGIACHMLFDDVPHLICLTLVLELIFLILLIPNCFIILLYF